MNLLAPFSVVWKDNQLPKIAKNEAKAEANRFPGSSIKTNDMLSGGVDGQSVSIDFEIILDTGLKSGDDTSGIWDDIQHVGVWNPLTTNSFDEKSFWLEIIKADSTTVIPDTYIVSDSNLANDGYVSLTRPLLGNKVGNNLGQDWIDSYPNGPSKIKIDYLIGNKSQGYPIDTIDNLKPDTEYLARVIYYLDGNAVPNTMAEVRFKTPAPTKLEGKIGDGKTLVEGGKLLLPGCEIIPDFDDGTSFSGCFVQLAYWGLYAPTAYLFGLAGVFFDAVFKYSIDDSSYRTTFVTQGWAIVRDMCNIFFIFVLLYAAFKMIFGSHGAKSVIVNVIIIGLLINFSLLTTQILVDTSNILARLFYNSQAIKIETDNASGAVTHGGQNLTENSGNNQISLSSALINKINPQNLILSASKVTVSDDAGHTGTASATDGIGVGGYFLVIFLASIVNVIGFFVFISVGLIFVARVVSIWMAMVFAPFAFFSYTVPALSKAKIIGWKNWWSDLLGICFIAPLFMFFMYLIILFLEKGFANFLDSTKNGPNFVLGIIIPFAFIMILLLTAKKLAKEYAGSIGQTVTGAVTAVGAAALGGAALGAAVIGRNTVGSLAKFTQNDGARKNALTYQNTQNAAAKLKGWGAVNPFNYLKVAGSAVGDTVKLPAASAGYLASRIGRKKDPHTGKETSWFQREGSKVVDKSHAAHVLDEKAQALKNDKSATYKDLTDDEKKTVRERIDRDIVSKEMHNKVYEKLNGTERANVDGMRVAGDPNGEWSQGANMAKGVAATRGDHVHTSEDLGKAVKVDTAVSEFVNALRKGSYDVRNLSKTKSVSGGLAKLGVGLAASVALGVRSGLKSLVGINHGTGQKDVMKDLKDVLTEALKGVKIQMPSGGGDHGGGHDDHGGGHDDHGGGHH